VSHLERPSIGVVLNLINEYDIITRVDPSYIRSIISLHRDVQSSSLSSWKMPPPDFWHLGQHVVLRVRISNSQRDPESTELKLSAFALQPLEFASLLFLRIEVHSRVYYAERIEKIAQGELTHDTTLNFTDGSWLSDL
jgi:hypothetical protein